MIAHVTPLNARELQLEFVVDGRRVAYPVPVAEANHLAWALTNLGPNFIEVEDASGHIHRCSFTPEDARHFAQQVYRLTGGMA